MNVIRRISATFSSVIDRAVGSIENHDAVIAASVEQLKTRSGELKAKLRRMRADISRVEQKQAELDRSVQQWAKRALETDSDEATAIECMQRRRLCAEQRERLNTSVHEMRRAEKQLMAALEQLSERQSRFEQQRRVMRSRQVAADASRSVETLIESDRLIDVEDTFERWDADISSYEMDLDPLNEIDALEQRFVGEEQRLELAAELAALKQNDGAPS